MITTEEFIREMHVRWFKPLDGRGPRLTLGENDPDGGIESCVRELQRFAREMSGPNAPKLMHPHDKARLSASAVILEDRLRDIKEPIASALGESHPDEVMRFGKSLTLLMAAAYAIGGTAAISESGQSAALRKLQSEKGKKSAEKRRLNRRAGWEKHARELRAQIINGLELGERISQDKLASEIEARWKREGEAPVHKTLLEFVRQVDKDGTLPRRPSSRGLT